MASDRLLTTERETAAEILASLADSCDRGEDDAFWILVSAAAYLKGYDLNDGEGSTVACWWQKQEEKITA